MLPILYVTVQCVKDGDDNYDIFFYKLSLSTVIQIIAIYGYTALTFKKFRYRAQFFVQQVSFL